jgi:glycogen operon protein
MFTLPAARFGERWSLVLSTADPEAEPNSTEAAAGEELFVTSRSVTLLRRR